MSVLGDVTLENGDIVVSQDTRDGQRRYAIRAVPGGEQYLLHSYDEAVAHAITFAKRQGVGVWIRTDRHITLITSFRDRAKGDAATPAAGRRTLDRLRAEFLEMPDLRLTAPQVQRLCGVDPNTCKSVLDALVDARFLRLGPDGRYVRLADEQHARRSAS